MSRILRMKDGSSVDLVGIGAIIVLCITIALVVQQVAPIVSLYKHPPKEATGTRDPTESRNKYAEALAWDRDQIRNRSLFFIPPKPDEKPTEVVEKHYGGPTLSMFVNGTAFFSDGQKVSAAEPDSKSLHFVRADPPWSVRVRWKGGEFDVPIFEKIQLSSLTSSLAGSFPTSGSSSTPAASTDKPGAAPSSDGKSPPTDAPPPPPPMTSGGGGPGGGGDAPPPPPPAPGGPSGGPSGPPPGEPSPPTAPPSGSPPSSPAPTPASPSGGPSPAPAPSSEPAHPSDHR